MTVFGCDYPQKDEIAGLYVLEELKIDENPEYFNPNYLQINIDNTFNVAAKSGDISGVYSLRKDKLTLTSRDNKWFNGTWQVFLYDNEILLKGKGTYPRDNPNAPNHQLNTKLLYKKTKRISDNEDFLKQLTGRWQLYKTRTEIDIIKHQNLQFTLSESGEFKLIENGNVIDRGKTSIDTRHHKITFENENKVWRVSFIGSELRIYDKYIGVKYSLRRFVK